MAKPLATPESKRGRGDARKLRVALLRAGGNSKLQAAAAEGINPRTIYEWERLDVVYQTFERECMAEVKREGLAEAMAVVRMALRAVDPAGTPIPMHVRLRAAQIVIQSADRHDTLSQVIDLTVDGGITVIEVPNRSDDDEPSVPPRLDEGRANE